MNPLRDFFSIAVCALLGCSFHAFGLGADYAPGAKISHPDTWPHELYDLAIAPSRVAGYFVNADDYLAFRGETADFQRFLDTCAALNEFGKMTLHLHQGKGAFQWLDKTREAAPCDWKLEIIDQQFRSDTQERITPRYRLDLHVWLGGSVKMGAVKLPAAIMVSKD